MPRAPAPTPPPPPPVVDCDAGPAAPLPPIPPLVEMDVWAAAVIGIFQGEVTKRHAEHECMDKLRAKGVIR